MVEEEGPDEDGPLISLSEIVGGTFTDGLKLCPNSDDVEEDEFLRGRGGFGVRGDTFLGGSGGGGSSFTFIFQEKPIK